MAVVGAIERGVPEEEEETEGWSEVISVGRGLEDDRGGETRGMTWAGGGEVSEVGETLVTGKAEGAEEALTAETAV